MSKPVVNTNSLAHLKFTAQWSDEVGSHRAIQHFEKFNMWRDIDLLPDALQQDILHKPAGPGRMHEFNPGELVDEWQSAKLVNLPSSNFTGRLRNGEKIQPRAGRYYPKGMISGVNGYFSENLFPTRFVAQQEEQILVDYNHPLAKKRLQLSVNIIEVLAGGDEHGGRCNDVLQDMLSNGPGMQIPHEQQATDFFDAQAFERIDDGRDSVFYRPPRKVHHLDAYARQKIGDIYADLIPSDAHVLDLMSSWESHLPETLTDLSVSGLGMNAEELMANPVLKDFRVHDLNDEPSIPSPDNTFDAVICSASVEYLIEPMDVFKEIRRVLKPGGVCIMTFSNRWFPTKAIRLWTEAHEFERMGIVVEYFRQSGWSNPVNTLSRRGLHRPVDDPHYAKTQISDPVYAVWSHK